MRSDAQRRRAGDAAGRDGAGAPAGGRRGAARSRGGACRVAGLRGRPRLRVRLRTPALRRAAVSLQRRQLDRAEEAHLVLEGDAEALVRPGARASRHQRERVGARRPARVLDEVRVRGSRSRAPPIRSPLSPHASISAPGARARGRVLEDAAEGALGRRLARLAPGEQLARPSALTSAGSPRREPQARPRRRPRPGASAERR